VAIGSSTMPRVRELAQGPGRLGVRWARSLVQNYDNRSVLSSEALFSLLLITEQFIRIIIIV
jgi:hypothetical protein